METRNDARRFIQVTTLRVGGVIPLIAVFPTTAYCCTKRTTAMSQSSRQLATLNRLRRANHPNRHHDDNSANWFGSFKWRRRNNKNKNENYNDAKVEMAARIIPKGYTLTQRNNDNKSRKSLYLTPPPTTTVKAEKSKTLSNPFKENKQQQKSKKQIAI